jgi:hypothetical protein
MSEQLAFEHSVLASQSFSTLIEAQRTTFFRGHHV